NLRVTLVTLRRRLVTDESKYVVFGVGGPNIYYKKVGSPVKPEHVKQVVKHGGGHVMVWGYITPQGVGRLHLIEGTMNASKYVEILSTSFYRPLLKSRIRPSSIIFQHDNDPKHTARATKKWILDHRLKFVLARFFQQIGKNFGRYCRRSGTKFPRNILPNFMSQCPAVSASVKFVGSRSEVAYVMQNDCTKPDLVPAVSQCSTYRFLSFLSPERSQSNGGSRAIVNPPGVDKIELKYEGFSALETYKRVALIVIAPTLGVAPGDSDRFMSYCGRLMLPEIGQLVVCATVLFIAGGIAWKWRREEIEGLLELGSVTEEDLKRGGPVDFVVG
ncbi:hypothetical protein FRC10_009719, partial [Ceratobasidium sp. 414]